MSGQARYGLLYTEYGTSPHWRLSFPKLAVYILCCPLFSFLFCIAYSVLFNFESATFTHCQVYNFLPSISAAIGNFSPQREVWQIAITLQAVPRLCVAYLYLKQHSNLLYNGDLWLSYIAFILNIIENLSLIVLSYFTSSKHYGKTNMFYLSRI